MMLGMLAAAALIVCLFLVGTHTAPGMHEKKKKTKKFSKFLLQRMQNSYFAATQCAQRATRVKS